MIKKVFRRYKVPTALPKVVILKRALLLLAIGITQVAASCDGSDPDPYFNSSGEDNSAAVQKPVVNPSKTNEVPIVQNSPVGNDPYTIQRKSAKECDEEGRATATPTGFSPTTGQCYKILTNK